MDEWIYAIMTKHTLFLFLILSLLALYEKEVKTHHMGTSENASRM